MRKILILLTIFLTSNFVFSQIQDSIAVDNPLVRDGYKNDLFVGLSNTVLIKFKDYSNYKLDTKKATVYRNDSSYLILISKSYKKDTLKLNIYYNDQLIDSISFAVKTFPVEKFVFIKDSILTPIKLENDSEISIDSLKKAIGINYDNGIFKKEAFKVYSYDVYAYSKKSEKFYSKRIKGNMFPEDLKCFLENLEVGDLISFSSIGFSGSHGRKSNPVFKITE